MEAVYVAAGKNICILDEKQTEKFERHQDNRDCICCNHFFGSLPSEPSGSFPERRIQRLSHSTVYSNFCDLRYGSGCAGHLAPVERVRTVCYLAFDSGRRTWIYVSRYLAGFLASEANRPEAAAGYGPGPEHQRYGRHCAAAEDGSGWKFSG